IQRAGDPAPRPARLVGTYPEGDLAVIRAENPAGLTPARFGDSSKAQAGDVVLAVGNPLGLAGSVTDGIISATRPAVVRPTPARPPRRCPTRSSPARRSTPATAAGRW